jgi:hypothetical protein
MTGIPPQLIYVESVDDEGAFAWYEGKLLTEAQHAERAEIHREMTDIVRGAQSDVTAEWGRAARCGNRLLVEVEVIHVARTPHPHTATVVVSVRRPDEEWAGETAKEIATTLREEGLEIEPGRLARAFVRGWASTSRSAGQRAKKAVAVAGAALALAVWSVLRRARMRRRRQSSERRQGDRG